MRILQFFASLFLLLAFAFIFALPSYALSLPQLFTYEGLTFTQPLTFSNVSELSPQTLTFGETREISIKQPQQQIVLAEAIVSPPPIEEKILNTLIPDVKAEEPKQEPSTTPAPTAMPFLTQTPTPTPSPTPLSNENMSTPGGLDAEKLFSMSNAFRQSRGLTPFTKDERSCQLAKERAPEIAAEVAGDYMHAGLKNRNLPYWNTENIISMRTEEAAFNWWINDKIHHDAIIGNYTYSCVACNGNSCAQEFTNFQPK